MELSSRQINLLILMLAALTAMAPLAIDAYLPAMPSIASQLHVAIHDVELSLSLFLGGFAMGQIIGGPLSDRFGRRRVIFLGISLFIIGTTGIALSNAIESIWLWRVFQALGGGLAIVNASAVIRDISSGRDSARHMSQMAIIMMVAPLMAPLIGMVLLHLAGWRAIFIFLLIYALLLGWMLIRYLPETHKRSAIAKSPFKRYAEVLTHRHAMGFLLAQCCSYGALFTFITASPTVYMGYFDVSETIYPFLFGANVIVMVVFNRVNMRLLHFQPPAVLLGIGQLLQLTVGLLLLAYVLLSTDIQLWLLVVGIMLFIGFQGLTVANAVASTVEFFPHSAATATALLGSCGFLTGAASGWLVTSLSDGSPFPMILVMSLCAVFGLAFKRIIQSDYWLKATN
ncbi:multidrug effflux MFS transporter [Methylophaga sp. OBS3]|uniref:multidrug effflux MFS transporter n=1 Tax=Methylophaga sp. OBS3 TaxID=2991934 RepID=UPI002258EB09|nr:multidrug effflux MFS transporter [Methylophaga sp. OBS3]MCX4190081.1 multidrug effflux MFS transporter [Methylophaga sp. OBS3]